MADEDRAQDIELREWEANNRSRNVTKVRYSPGEVGYGPEFCKVEVCGEEMPEQRRAWGFCICIDCQQRAEERASRLG